MEAATQTRPVTFIAFSHDLRVTMEPDRHQYATDGAGNLTPAGVQKGFSAQFENRKFTTDDPKVIAYMRGHELFNVARGFREDYDSDRSTLDEQIEAITTFAADANMDGLRELIALEESAGDHGRGNVLGPARKALERLEQIDTSADASEDADADEAGTTTEQNGASGSDPGNSD